VGFFCDVFSTPGSAVAVGGRDGWVNGSTLATVIEGASAAEVDFVAACYGRVETRPSEAH